MKHALSILILSLIPIAGFAQQTHLAIMAPERMDTDLVGPVQTVDTKITVNVSGKFERERKEYDRIGNLLNETEWDAEGKMINTLTNYYSEAGNFERHLYIDFEDHTTNSWDVILSPETHQLAMKKKNGAAAILTYSPNGYLLDYRSINSDKSLKFASSTKRGDDNRVTEYTRYNDQNQALYTYWFKWKENGFIDRERQSYLKEDGERLHIYDYLKTDDHGNWTQRIMARYDIGGKSKEKVYERTVIRTIEYFAEETDADASGEKVALAADESTTAAPTGVDAPSGMPEKKLPASDGEKKNEKAKPVAAGSTAKTQAELKSLFTYAFDDISDKLVIISCKSDAGRSSGSGFVAKMNDQTYLLTNQHVIMGSETITLKTVAGETLTPRSVELSRSRDIARILIDDRAAFEISEKFAFGIPMGVFGNSEGAGVATELYGEVTGLGVDLVEVSAEFVSGNSGSPVLDKDQKVIGIASFVHVTWAPPTKEEEEKKKADGKDSEKEEKFKSTTRRFCYRLTDVEWQPVNWKDYNNKYGKMYCISETVTSDIFDIIAVWANAPLKKIEKSDDMDHDLAAWVKKHNEIIDRYERRQFREVQFYNAYSGSLDMLSDTCLSRARRIAMFSKQRELTEFLQNNFERQSRSLEYASAHLRKLSDDL